jgi:hypothetical protein
MTALVFLTGMTVILSRWPEDEFWSSVRVGVGSVATLWFFVFLARSLWLAAVPSKQKDL